MLRQIACDGSIKIPVRTLAPLANNLKNNRGISSLSVVVAAWVHFLQMSVNNNDEIHDPMAAELADAIKANQQLNSLDVKSFLSLPGLISKELSVNDAFLSSVSEAFEADNALFGQK